MEIPDLSLSAISNLDDHVSVVDQVKISAIWELGYDVEVSLNVKSELLVELTLGWLLLIFININDFPSLVDLSILVFNNNVSVLVINSTLDCYNLTSFIGNESILVSEELPPS